MVEAFMCGSTKEICKKTGLSQSTVTRYRNDVNFQSLMRDRASELMQDATRKMQGSLSDCVTVLNQIINDEKVSPQVRVNAIQVFMTQATKWTETVDILRRIEELERKSNEE